MDVGERLKEERERLGMTQTALAEIGGVGKTTQINYEKNNRNPDTGYLLAIDAVGIDTYYVLTGRRAGVADSESLEMVGFENAFPVPMYDIEAAAGAGRLFDSEMIDSTFYLPVELFEADAVDPAHVVGVTARGDSMGDTVRDREQVLVNRARRTPDGVFLLRMDDELRIKRVQRVAGGAWVLISDNPAYERELVQPEDVEIIGQCWRKVGRVF